jgi:CRP/FNR family transcriptional regulator
MLGARGPGRYDARHTGGGGSAIDLERTELFRALSPERLARVKPKLVERSFARQQVLYVEGAPAERLWVVRRGRVRLYKGSRRGQLLTLDALGPGEVFGAVSALELPTYPSSAQALETGSAWVLPREAFLRLLESEPPLALEVLRVVGRRLRDAENRLRSAAQDPAPARLAQALLHSARAGEARVTRRVLAEAAGTTVETAIRVLRRFEREGWVRGEVGLIHVLDEPALRRLAGAP